MSALDAVLALMLGRSGGPAIAPGTEEAIVRLASAHLVLPALHGPAGSGLSDDFQSFLASVVEANRRRNQRLRTDLISLGRALNAHGIEPTVLKGGVFVLEDPAAAPWRFLGDLDLLIAPDATPAALAAAHDLGLEPDHADYVPGRDAHLPPLVSADGVIAVELHTRLFAGAAGGGVEAALPACPTMTTIEGARIRIPPPELRLAHLLAHSQLHHGFHAARRILLRDVLDMARLRPAPVSIGHVLALFPDPCETPAARSLLLAAALLLSEEPAVPGLKAADRLWADRAIARLRTGSRKRRLALLKDSLAAELARIAREPGRARRLSRLALDPARLARRLRKRTQKLRQALWA